MSATTIESPPLDQDLSAIKTGDWPMRQFPLGQREHPTRRQIIFKQSVLNDIYEHGLSAPGIEVCGVLVGNVYRDHLDPFVFIEANIRGNFSAGMTAQVTFTAQTWTHIQEVMDQSYPDLRILGWYHTHPGHGIFLSDMDLFIHQNFFSLPWHVAFVYDPQQQEEGLFAWRNANLIIESFVVQKDAVPLTRVARRVPELPGHRGIPSASQPPMPWSPITPEMGSLNAVAAPLPGQRLDSQAPLEVSPADEADAPTVPDDPTPSSSSAFSSATLSSPGSLMLSAARQAAEASADDGLPPIPSPAPRARSNREPLVNLTRASASAAPEVLDLSLRLQNLERRQRWMTAIVALAILIAVAWPLALAGYALMHSPTDAARDLPGQMGNSSLPAQVQGARR